MPLLCTKANRTEMLFWLLFLFHYFGVWSNLVFLTATQKPTMGTAALSLSPQKRGRLRIITKVPDFSFLLWAKRVLPEPAPTLSQEHTNRRTMERAPLPLVRSLLWLQKVDKLGVKALYIRKVPHRRNKARGSHSPILCL